MDTEEGKVKTKNRLESCLVKAKRALRAKNGDKMGLQNSTLPPEKKLFLFTHKTALISRLRRPTYQLR